MLRPIPAWPDKNWPGRTVQRPAPHSSPSPDNAPSDNPQMLDHAKGMFYPGPGPITLPVKRPVRTVEPLAPSRLAVHPPVNIPGNGRLSATLTGIRLVPVDDGLLTMQALVHDDRIMHRRIGHRHTVHPALCVSADVRLHAKIPGIPLFCLFHLRVPLPLPILRRTRRTDDAGIHNRPFMQ